MFFLRQNKHVCLVHILALNLILLGAKSFYFHNPMVLALVGGTDASGDQATFIVSFQYKGEHFCAGSIISRNWVVTAAHCLSSRRQVENSRMVAGSRQLSCKVSETQKRSIEHYVVHELYTGGTSPYDIGMVYTTKPFRWTETVSAVRLPTKKAYPNGSGKMYGWGSTSTTQCSIYPNALQKARFPIISLKSCDKIFRAKGIDVHSTNLCTQSSSGNTAICISDSGGPLIKNNVLIGIASWAEFPCGRTNTPSVFTRVFEFVKWIEKVRENY